MNAGRGNNMCLSACCVLPVPDSIEGIYDAIKNTALVQKAGGGTGFAFDELRPTGDVVASSGGRTSGPVAFMKVFDGATGAIQQGAFRRGANMGMMSIEHPDSLKFIKLKSSPTVLENFNLSIKVSDRFMLALRDRPHEPHVVINPRSGQRYMIPVGIDISTYTIDDLVPVGSADRSCFTVRDVWTMVVQAAHATGEPGICFIGRVNETNPTPEQGRIESMNACGEQPLLPYESCNLGSVNLARFISPRGRTINWKDLKHVTRNAVRFLDNVIDINSYPIPQIQDATLGNRKIGLGVMGFADALILMGVRYDSDEAVQLAAEVSRFVTDIAHETSETLAKLRGAFPNWEGSVWDTVHHQSMRNATCTTIAPTGSISILAGCSGGIEPIFSLATTRRALDDEEFLEIHPLIERMGERDGWMTDRIGAALIDGVPPAEVAGFPEELASVLVTAHQIAPEWHVRIQAAFQKHIDNAVSKTVNLPAQATVEDVDQTFRLAYRLGCKGITVYRDGSREGQTLSAAGNPPGATPVTGNTPRLRGRTTRGQTFKFRTGCGTLFVTVNHDGHGVCEVFANLGKAGGCPAQSEATCRAVSTSLRSGVDPNVLIGQLKGIRCLSASVARKDRKDIKVLSCPDAIARAIEEAIAGHPDCHAPLPPVPAVRECPHFGRALRRESGCSVCDSCLYDSCG